MKKNLNEYDIKFEEDIVNKLDKKYEYDLDKKLVACVNALYKVEKEEILSDDELDIVNLFLAEEKVDFLEFLEIENYDDEEIFGKLGKYAVIELPFDFRKLQKELITILELNREELKFSSNKDYDKLKREIKAIEHKYSEELKSNAYKTIFVLNVVNFYITSLSKKYATKTSLNIIERYFIYKGWKLLNNLTKNVDDITKKQRENRTEDYVKMWEYRNMYNSNNKIELYIYRKKLLLDLKRIERFYREISMEKNVTVATKEAIINYYTYTLMMMYIASVENSGEIVIAICENDIQLDAEIEKYIILGAQRAKDLLIKNKRYPSPRQLVQKLNITKGRAEKYDLNLLYLDTLSSGTRNRLLGIDKPQDLKKIVKDSKIKRIKQGKEFFNLKKEKNLTDAEIAQKCGINRKLVGLRMNEYIKEEYRIGSKKDNFDEDEFIKLFGITKNKLVRIIK